jgi:hypothetical protein
LIGFVCAFGFIRLSTRLMRSPRVPWWPGSVVSEDGVHVHHLFLGIVLMMVAGALSFAAGETDGPWYSIYAVLFGIGSASPSTSMPCGSTSMTSTGPVRAAALSTPRWSPWA